MKDHNLTNEPLSSISHFIGALLSVAALVLLIISAAKHGGAWHIVSYSIFGSTLILLYSASTIYHLISKIHKFKKIFRKIDLSMIFILIAGTYTPIALVPLRGEWGWSLFAIIWTIAILGIILQHDRHKMKSWHFNLMFLVSGWLAIISLPILIKAISFRGFIWLLAGGIFYSLGLIFFVLDKKVKRNRWFGMHEIFHLFVMAGSFCHFWLMFKIVAYIN